MPAPKPKPKRPRNPSGVEKRKPSAPVSQPYPVSQPISSSKEGRCAPILDEACHAAHGDSAIEREQRQPAGTQKSNPNAYTTTLTKSDGGTANANDVSLAKMVVKRSPFATIQPNLPALVHVPPGPTFVGRRDSVYEKEQKAPVVGSISNSILHHAPPTRARRSQSILYATTQSVPQPPTSLTKRKEQKPEVHVPQPIPVIRIQPPTPEDIQEAPSFYGTIRPKSVRHTVPLVGSLTHRQIKPLWTKPYEQLKPPTYEHAERLPPIRNFALHPSSPTYYLDLLRFVAEHGSDKLIYMHHLLDRQFRHPFIWAVNRPVSFASYGVQGFPACALSEPAFKHPLCNMRIHLEFEIRGTARHPVRNPKRRRLHFDIFSPFAFPLTVGAVLEGIHSSLQKSMPKDMWDTLKAEEKFVLSHTLSLFSQLRFEPQKRSGRIQTKHDELDLYRPWVKTVDVFERKKIFGGLQWVGQGPSGHEFLLCTE